MFVHPLNHEEEEEGKILNFLTVYAQGLLIFHQSFLHFTSGTCRFKHFQKRIIDVTFFLIPIPEDNILDHLSPLSYPPSHTSTVNGIVLSVERKRKQYQNRSTRMLVKLMAPEYHGPAPVFWIPGCYGRNDSCHHSWWVQAPYWWFTQHTWFTLSLLPPSLQWACSMLNLSHSRGQNLPFDFLIFISYSPSFLPG